LEALHLVGHARSFRGRVRDGLIRQGQSALQVYLEWETQDGRQRRAGLWHEGSQWKGRLDGQDVRQLGELCQALAVVTFEPGSHALVEGGSEDRRRYLDWGVFHVEPAFWAWWRRYARALKQRNEILRRTPDPEQLEAWEFELAQAGEAITAIREAYVLELREHAARLLPELLPAAGAIDLALFPGWRRQEMSLRDALLLGRERDLALGYTASGPHRADVRMTLRDLPGRERLSRGQAKQLAVLLLLAQASHLASVQGEWPLLQLDDVGSELDRAHQRRVLEVLSQSGAQVLVTGTECPPGWGACGIPLTVFHVERGAVTAAPT
jgi:DNA replication and repair protein RecF